MKFAKHFLGTWYENTLVRNLFEIFCVYLPLGIAIRTFIFGVYVVPSGSMETTFLCGERFVIDKATYWVRQPRRGELIAFNEPVMEYSTNPVVNLWQRYLSLSIRNITKRVIGVPGDHVVGVVEEGTPVVYVNGEKLDESKYLNKYPLILMLSRPLYEYRYRTDGIALVPRSYVPAMPYDTQPFYRINPELIARDPETGDPLPLIYPGTPLESGADIFDHTLGEDEYWVMGDNRLGSSDSRDWGILRGSLIHGKVVFRVLSIDTDNAWLLADLINPVKLFQKVRWRRCLQFVS